MNKENICINFTGLLKIKENNGSELVFKCRKVGLWSASSGRDLA
jgi:hypothetical protein